METIIVTCLEDDCDYSEKFEKDDTTTDLKGCPKCGSETTSVCPKCKKPLKSLGKHCMYCFEKLTNIRRL